MTNYFETLSIIKSPTGNLDTTTNSSVSNNNVCIDQEETWHKLLKLQNNLFANVTNKRMPKLHPHKDINSGNVYTARDENKSNGKDLIGKIPNLLKEEIFKNRE
ncbi:MAG: hypothetical protein KTV77_05325 [Wolbachia endosymbiont of Fragariocoptes setiger]|nr:hypothetical protein [Wolbachia endosymbiont of Fragariocoptes setiger]